jgi:hypothetical protein
LTRSRFDFLQNGFACAGIKSGLDALVLLSCLERAAV